MNISTAFRNQVKKNPAANAVFDCNRRLSRLELDRLSDAIAARLPRGARSIGIVMDHSVEMIASIFAVLKLGAAYVPAEPSFPIERIRFMMNECAVDAVITNSKHLALFDRPTVVVDADFQADARAEDRFERTVEPDGDSLAYILYTSGTTGKPKGIAVTNANVLHYARAFQNEFRLDARDVMLQHSVCSFDIFVEEVFGSLLNGAALAIPSLEIKNDLNRLMRFVEQNGVTIISGFPYLLQSINELKQIPASLRLLISGGDVLRAAYVDRLVDRLAVYNTYGPGETTVCASYYDCSRGIVLDDGTYPIGKPVLGADIILSDADGVEVSTGAVGEICILGDGVSHGYIGAPRPESRNFETLPDGRRLYRSGDLAYRLPDGNLAFLHRKDDQIMIVGRRVEPSEVENVLLQSELIRQACVDSELDDNRMPRMIAYIVKRDESVTVEAIKNYLARWLVDFMIPECFVELERLPLTPNGKVDRRALHEILTARIA